jgi:acyl-CoA hydrolase
MASDFLVDLMNSGVVTNITKPFDRGVSTTAILLGKTKLYEFAHNNKKLKLRPSWHTHSGDVHLLKNFVSINSALEVDLTGQVGAEELNGIPVSAIGGQPDLVRAAHRSDGGHAIIALPSSAKDGKFSRIVSKLSGPVTTARSDVDVIVTENGAVDLRGKDLGQRRRALISIAAPNFQEDLMKS